MTRQEFWLKLGREWLTLNTIHTRDKRRQFQPTLLAPQPHYYLKVRDELPITPAHLPDTSFASIVSRVPVQASRQFAPLVIPAQDAGHVVADGARLLPSTVHTGKRKTRLRMTSALVTAIMLVGIAALYIWLNAKDAADVTLYQVDRQSSIQYVGGGGIVFPRQQLNLSYPVAERVVAIMVKAGDDVAPNQPLLRLDPTQLNAQVKQASDNMGAAQVYLNSVSTSSNAITVAQAQQQYDIARNKYNALVAQSSSPLLHNGVLVSPMRGVITEVNINSGEVFSADTTLLTVMDESIAVVHTKIPLVNLDQAALNQKAIVTPSALPDHNLPGVVGAIIPHADPQTDTFELWVNVPNPGHVLLPGMSAFVRLQTPYRAFIVPRLAVLNPDQYPVVFVALDQHAYIRRVHVVGRVRDAAMIDSGITAGEEIVLVGLDKLHDGQRVNIRATEKHDF
jgi:RND family efflux transporter MFP subunit